MNHKLKPIIDEILQDFTALGDLNAQMLSTKKQDAFSLRVEEKTKDLEGDDKKRIHNELFSWGPLEKLRTRKDLFDIIICGQQDIFYEDSSGLKTWDDFFITKRTFENFIEFILEKSETLANHNQPFANGKIDNFRIHLALSPTSHEINLTLRKHRDHFFSLPELAEQGFLSSRQLNFFTDCIENRKNVLVVGPTGSGKTTFLNSLLSTCSKTHRTILIEDVDELKLPSKLGAKLLTRDSTTATLKPIGLQDLIRQALRMRPDRLVVGEVRGEEAKDLLMALATGHSGSMGTLHARSAQEALLRLEMLVQLGAPQWSLYSIRQLIQLSLDYIVVLKEDRMEKGIAQICKIGSHESFGLLLDDLEDHP